MRTQHRHNHTCVGAGGLVGFEIWVVLDPPEGGVGFP